MVRAFDGLGEVRQQTGNQGDGDPMRLEKIWASAGTPFAAFRLTPAILVELTGGRVADVKK